MDIYLTTKHRWPSLFDYWHLGLYLTVPPSLTSLYGGRFKRPSIDFRPDRMSPTYSSRRWMAWLTAFISVDKKALCLCHEEQIQAQFRFNNNEVHFCRQKSVNVSWITTSGLIQLQWTTKSISVDKKASNLRGRSNDSTKKLEDSIVTSNVTWGWGQKKVWRDIFCCLLNNIWACF